MEKLVYIVWKKQGLADGEFQRRMLGRVADGLLELGARGLSMNLVDEYVADAKDARITRFDPPVAGMVSLWLDMADDRGPFEEVLCEATGRRAGYLVVESVPLRNTTHVAPLGERTDGVNVVACIERPDSMPYGEWIGHWHGHHREIALETQCTYEYIRNEVVRALHDDAPSWAAIVEEGFPSAAVTDPMLWYRAEGSEAKLQENFARMMESVQAFLDIDRVETNPMTQYRLEDL